MVWARANHSSPCPPLAPRLPANRSARRSTHDYVLLSINCLIYSACKKMWSSSITCVVARLLVCACACVMVVRKGGGWGGVMDVGMCVLVYLCRSTEGTGGRKGERERKRKRLVRHLYLQTTGWVPTGGREIRLKNCVSEVCIRKCLCVCVSGRETERDRQTERNPFNPFKRQLFSPSTRIWKLFSLSCLIFFFSATVFWTAELLATI